MLAIRGVDDAAASQRVRECKRADDDARAYHAEVMTLSTLPAKERCRVIAAKFSTLTSSTRIQRQFASIAPLPPPSMQCAWLAEIAGTNIGVDDDDFNIVLNAFLLIDNVASQRAIIAKHVTMMREEDEELCRVLAQRQSSSPLLRILVMLLYCNMTQRHIVQFLLKRLREDLQVLSSHTAAVKRDLASSNNHDLVNVRV
jgi:hypothetical protein